MFFIECSGTAWCLRAGTACGSASQTQTPDIPMTQDCFCSFGRTPLWLTVAVKLHPSDVVAHALHLPARQRGFHHGQVGFAAGAGEGSRHVALHARRVGDAEDLKADQRVRWVTGDQRGHGLRLWHTGSLKEVRGGFTSALINRINLLILFAWNVWSNRHLDYRTKPWFAALSKVTFNYTAGSGPVRWRALCVKRSLNKSKLA